MNEPLLTSELSEENASERTRRVESKSLLPSLRLGNRDLRLLYDPDRDRSLGPLKMNAPADTKSTLGTEPWRELELSLDRLLDGADTSDISMVGVLTGAV